MPVIEIQALPQREGTDVQAAIKKVALAVAKTLDVPEHAVWCIWQDIKPGHYVEGKDAAGVQPDDTHPPIVRLTMFEGRSSQMIEKVLDTIATELQVGLGMASKNAFITYHEAQSGTVFTGGEVRRKSNTV